MFYAFCHNWSIVLCETKSKLFPARIPNYQAVFRKVWILYKFGFWGKSKSLDLAYPFKLVPGFQFLGHSFGGFHLLND